MSRSPRYRLIDASGLPFKKSKTDTEGERWCLFPVFIDLSNAGPNSVCLKSLYVRTTMRGRGHARRVLSALCGAADICGITLRLEAHAYGRKSKLSTEALINWYARYGFVPRRSASLTGRVSMIRRASRAAIAA